MHPFTLLLPWGVVGKVGWRHLLHSGEWISDFWMSELKSITASMHDRGMVSVLLPFGVEFTLIPHLKEERGDASMPWWLIKAEEPEERSWQVSLVSSKARWILCYCQCERIPQCLSQRRKRLQTDWLRLVRSRGRSVLDVPASRRLESY